MSVDILCDSRSAVRSGAELDVTEHRRTFNADRRTVKFFKRTVARRARQQARAALRKAQLDQ